jgi:hypothetical protein
MLLERKLLRLMKLALTFVLLLPLWAIALCCVPNVTDSLNALFYDGLSEEKSRLLKLLLLWMAVATPVLEALPASRVRLCVW